MNPPVVRIFGLVLLLFGILVFSTSWWTVFGAEGLRDNPNNRRALLEEQRIKRGRILAADRRTLARPVPAPNETYTRRWPTGKLFAHAVGYSYTSFGRSGLERYYNDQLIGRRTELVGVVESLLGSDDVGDDLQTTLDPRAQQVAVDALQGRKGARRVFEAEREDVHGQPVPPFVGVDAGGVLGAEPARAEPHRTGEDEREEVRARSDGPWRRGVGMASQIWYGAGGPPSYAWVRCGADGHGQRDQGEHGEEGHLGGRAGDPVAQRGADAVGGQLPGVVAEDPLGAALGPGEDAIGRGRHRLTPEMIDQPA